VTGLERFLMTGIEELSAIKSGDALTEPIAVKPGSASSIAGRFVALLESTRPVSSLVPGTVACVAVFAREGVCVRGLLAGLAMYSLTAFGFQVNDILDYAKDRAAGVSRPIARGALSRRAAALFAVVLLLMTFAFSAWVGAGGGVLAATAVVLLLYTPSARKLPLIKGLYVAALCIAPLYYGSQVTGAPYAWPPYVLLSLFIVGREALMDSNEMAGDRSAGMVTVAVVFGELRTKRAGTLVMVLSMAVLASIAPGGVARIAALAAFVSLLCVLAWPHLDDAKKIALSRIPMLAAAVALAWG
jgi:4-hydroxybenzoate polyprenyltransferase